MSKSTEYLLMGGLVLIIVLSVVLVIWPLWDGAGTIEGAPTEFRFKCKVCEHEWTVDKETMESYYGGPRPLEREGYVYCIKCGGKDEDGERTKTAYMMLQCPACRKFYTPPGLLLNDNDRPTGSRNAFTCPECGINIHEWYRKRARER